MSDREGVVHRKGTTEQERLKARENALKESAKSHVKSGTFAGFMVFVLVGRYLFHLDSLLSTCIVGGIGGAFGALIARMETRSGEKTWTPNKAESDADRQGEVTEYIRVVEREQQFLFGGISRRFAVVVGAVIVALAIFVILLSYLW